MPLADMFAPDELPTRPDSSAGRELSASRCRHCGFVWGDHAITRPGTRTQPAHATMLRAGCCGMRRNFEPEAARDADHVR